MAVGLVGMMAGKMAVYLVEMRAVLWVVEKVYQLVGYWDD